MLAALTKKLDALFYLAAVQAVCKENCPLTSFVQRKLRIGYNHAVNLLTQMQCSGIVGLEESCGRRTLLKNHETAIIIYGRTGFADTNNAQALAQFFSKAEVIDDWTLGDHLPTDALCLSTDQRIQYMPTVKLPRQMLGSPVLQYSDVVQLPFIAIDNSTNQSDKKISHNNAAVFIHGAQGCGKTNNAVLLAEYFRKTSIVEYDETRLQQYPSNALVLSNIELPGSISFDKAMQMAGLTILQSQAQQVA